MKALGLDTVQVGKRPDRFYSPEDATEFAGLLRATGIRADSVVAEFAGERCADRDIVVRTVGFRPLHLIKERLEYLRKCVDFVDAIRAPTIENYVARGLKTDPMDELRKAGVYLKNAGW